MVNHLWWITTCNFFFPTKTIFIIDTKLMVIKRQFVSQAASCRTFLTFYWILKTLMECYMYIINERMPPSVSIMSTYLHVVLSAMYINVSSKFAFYTKKEFSQRGYNMYILCVWRGKWEVPVFWQHMMYLQQSSTLILTLKQSGQSEKKNRRKLHEQ